MRSLIILSVFTLLAGCSDSKQSSSTIEAHVDEETTYNPEDATLSVNLTTGEDTVVVVETEAGESQTVPVQSGETTTVVLGMSEVAPLNGPFFMPIFIYEVDPDTGDMSLSLELEGVGQVVEASNG